MQITGDRFTHVYYNEYEASIGVDGELIAGKLPVKQLKLVQAWAAIHEDELCVAWNKAVRNIPFEKNRTVEIRRNAYVYLKRNCVCR